MAIESKFNYIQAFTFKFVVKITKGMREKKVKLEQLKSFVKKPQEAIQCIKSDIDKDSPLKKIKVIKFSSGYGCRPRYTIDKKVSK